MAAGGAVTDPNGPCGNMVIGGSTQSPSSTTDVKKKSGERQDRHRQLPAFSCRYLSG